MYTFKKEERLCSKKLIEELFHNGSSFLLYPYRVVYLPTELSAPVRAQVVIGVSKKKFKRAVDRNLIKRRIREIYRLNKQELLYSFLEQQNIQLIFSVNYIGKELAEYPFMEKKLLAALKKLTGELSKSATESV